MPALAVAASDKLKVFASEINRQERQSRTETLREKATLTHPMQHVKQQTQEQLADQTWSPLRHLSISPRNKMYIIYYIYNINIYIYYKLNDI
jgi:hypothetical protein